MPGVGRRGIAFLDLISGMFAPSTALGYHNTLTNVRLFLICHGKKPENHKTTMTSFAVLARTAAGNRSRYIHKTKAAKAKKYKVFGKFYREIYHNPNTWKWYSSLVRSVRSGKHLATREDLGKAHRHLVAILSTNAKRSGNIALLKKEQVMEALDKAFQVFRKRFPEATIKGTERRLDRNTMIPAVLQVERGSKKDQEEKFVILRARDQQALLYYGQYLRPASESDLFFVDFNGKPLKDISRFLRDAGAAVGIGGLTTNLLRSLAETADSIHLPSVESHGVSDHLGHSSKTKDLYYGLVMDQKSVKAVDRLMYLMEVEGEDEDSETDNI